MEKVPQEKKVNSIENIENDEFMVIKEDFKEDLQERKLSSIENEIDNESKVIKTDFKFKNEKSDK